MTNISLSWGWSSDVGLVRAANQDSATADGDVFVVADGMGGHRGGEVASGITVDHLQEQGPVTKIEQLLTLVEEANALIRKRARDGLAGMGTTVVALAKIPNAQGQFNLGVVNVGDSRGYKLDSSAFTQFTLDHSLVAELARAGQITAEEAETHPKRNVVTRALGVESNVVIDSWLFAATAGERFLLCSDGLTNEVRNPEIEDVLRTVADPQEACDLLVKMANEGGGRDNITALIVDVIEVV